MYTALFKGTIKYGDALKNFKQEFFPLFLPNSRFYRVNRSFRRFFPDFQFVEVSRCRSSSSKLKFFPKFKSFLRLFARSLPFRSRKLVIRDDACCTEETLLEELFLKTKQRCFGRRREREFDEKLRS